MKLCLRVTKEGELRFLSHLEYSRALERALRRARLPLAYSEGFNPHVKLSLASALGVGVASVAEYAQVQLAEPLAPEEAAARLAQALPKGIRVLAVRAVARGERPLMAQAVAAAYRVLFDWAEPQRLAAAVEDYNRRAELPYRKLAPKLKAKYKDIDVKYYIERLSLTWPRPGQACLSFKCRITPQGSMKALDLLRALNQAYALDLQPEGADCCRLELYRRGRDGREESLLAVEKGGAV